MKGVIYVSGRYRARTIFGKLWNIWKARRVAQRLWKENWVVITPHLNTVLFNEDAPYIQGDVEIISRCVDVMFMMRGWEKSIGSKIEHRVAMELGLRIYYEQ